MLPLRMVCLKQDSMWGTAVDKLLHVHPYDELLFSIVELRDVTGRCCEF